MWVSFLVADLGVIESNRTSRKRKHWRLRLTKKNGFCANGVGRLSFRACITFSTSSSESTNGSSFSWVEAKFDLMPLLFEPLLPFTDGGICWPCNLLRFFIDFPPDRFVPWLFTPLDEALLDIGSSKKSWYWLQRYIICAHTLLFSYMFFAVGSTNRLFLICLQ